MNVVCLKCGKVSSIPDRDSNTVYRCYNCGAFVQRPTGESSAAVGLVGGAALGAAIGGPVGAVIGAVIGAILGKESKGVG